MAGANGRDAILLLDSADRSAECVSWAFGPGTRQTFSQMRGQVPTTLTMEIVQDHAADTLYDLAVTQAGSTVTGLYKPYGNATATSTKPHYSFNAVSSGPTGDVIVGGAASEDGTEQLTVEVAWQIDTWAKVSS